MAADDAPSLAIGHYAWYLDIGINRVGRCDEKAALFPEVDLTPVDSTRSVSRCHAEIIVAGKDVRIRDVGSTNGTWVDDIPANAGVDVRLGDACALRFGDVVLRYHPGAISPSTTQMRAAEGYDFTKTRLRSDSAPAESNAASDQQPRRPSWWQRLRIWRQARD